MKNLTDKIIVEEDIKADIAEKTIELNEEAVENEKEQAEAVPNFKAPKAKNFSKKALLTFLFILLNAVAILATALMDFGGGREIAPIGTVLGTFGENWMFALLAVGMFVAALVFEGLKRYVLLRSSLKHKGLFALGVRTAIISKYYDYITPFGSGGQPMEIYYMRKKGVPGSIASGITITFSIMPKVGDFIARAVSKILGFFHLAKNTEKIRENAVNSMKEYASCIIYFFSKYSFATLLVFLFGMCYNIAIYSVPYFIIRMCGVPAESVDYFTVFTLCLICFSTITIFPTPGNSGAAEISFYSIFSSYLASLGAGVLFWGVISWRVVTYYLFIIVGIGLMIVEKILGKKQHASIERSDDFAAVKGTVTKNSDSASSENGGLASQADEDDETETSRIDYDTLSHHEDEEN